MGQSVRSMAKVGDAAAIQADQNGHKKDQDGDVTQFLVGQNSDNLSTAVLLPSDEPSMSSIVDTQANSNPTDNSSSNLGSGDTSARLFSKRPWIGCQSLPLSDSRSQFTASSTSIVTTTATTTVIKGGEGATAGTTVTVGGGDGGGESGGAKNVSNSRTRSSLSKARLRKSSSSILNDISFGSLLVDNKKSSFKDIQEQQDDKTTTLRATTSSPEMEQLITMMKNHKVSEESEDRVSNMNDNNKNTRSITNTSTVDPITTTTTNNSNSNNNNNKITDTAENNLCKGLQIDQSDPKYAYLKSRKILPLPKSRLKKSTVDNNIQIAPSSNSNNGNNGGIFKDVYNLTDQSDRENKKKMRHSISPSTSSPSPSPSNNQLPQYHNILSNTSAFDFSMDKLKQLPLHHQHHQVLDPVTIKLDLDKSKKTVNVSGKPKFKKSITDKSTSLLSSSSDTKPANSKQSKRSSNSKKKKKGKVDESSLISALQHEPSSTINTRKGANNSNNSNNKKGQRNQQKKKWDDDFSTAPGGFLSSDITLFDNPLSDDWICLFCQYEVLCYGLEAAKRKNGFYRRKRERLQREASRRLMHHEPSDSDDELIFKDERHIRTS